MSLNPARILERLVDAYWTTAARHAWKQYQQRGRGAIVFTVEDDDLPADADDDTSPSLDDLFPGDLPQGDSADAPTDTPSPSARDTPAGGTPARDPSASDAPDVPGADVSGSEKRAPLRYLTFTDERASRGPFRMLYKLVQDYDPTREVVIAATLPDARTVFDVYQRTPAPPIAAEDE